MPRFSSPVLSRLNRICRPASASSPAHPGTPRQARWLATVRIAGIALLLLASPLARAAKTVLVFGDSLSAGYGIRQDAAWPALLAARLETRRLDYSVVNASISGETTSGGRTRIGETLARHRPAVVIVELGANDGLRGLPLATLRDNLTTIVRAATTRHTKVLLVGTRLPPNYGRYAEDFHRIFAEVARREKVALVDFLLDGIAERPDLFQADGLHPVAAAQPRLLDNVWQGLTPLLE